MENTLGRRLADAAPDGLLAATFLLAWVAPGLFSLKTVTDLPMVLVLEFIVIHSTAFMMGAVFGKGARGGRVGILLGFGAFYSVFVGGFALATGAWWALFAFWGLTIKRCASVVFGQEVADSEKALMVKTWLVSTGLFLLLVTVTSVVPVPELGLSPDLFAAVREGGTSGMWVEQPQRAMALGVLYFGALAVVALWRPFDQVVARLRVAEGEG